VSKWFVLFVAVTAVGLTGCTTWTGVCADYSASFHKTEYDSFEACDSARRAFESGARESTCSCVN